MNQLHYAHILELNDMKPAALRARYREVFGEPSRSGNTAWLRKRITWRLQSQAEGSLSERAKQRAAELANEADIVLLDMDRLNTTPRVGRDPVAHVVYQATHENAILTMVDGAVLYRDGKYATLDLAPTMRDAEHLCAAHLEKPEVKKLFQ